MRGSIICLFIILLVSTADNIYGQVATTTTDTLNFKKQTPLPLRNNSITVSNVFSKSKVESLPSDFYLKKLGFFCSKELQLDKITAIPIRFRLGSVVYTDKMEGKNIINQVQFAH